MIKMRTSPFQELMRLVRIKLSSVFIILISLILVQCGNVQEQVVKNPLEAKAKLLVYALNLNQERHQNCETTIIEDCLILLGVEKEGNITYYDFSRTDCTNRNALDIVCNAFFTGIGFDEKGNVVRSIKNHKSIFDYDEKKNHSELMIDRLKSAVNTNKKSVAELIDLIAARKD